MVVIEANPEHQNYLKLLPPAARRRGLLSPGQRRAAGSGASGEAITPAPALDTTPMSH